MIAPLEQFARTAAARPWAFALLLFAANAVVLPYLGILHDANLYAGQVLNRVEPGVLANDLFFRYGSQDKFSLFSPLAAPVARAVGIPAAFWLIYVASMLLYCRAAVALGAALFPGIPGVVAAAAMTLLEAPYGGLHTFSVPEGFTTPRLPACGFALFGLERTVRGKGIAAAACFVAAFALHPLMAVGPAGVAVGCGLVRTVGYARAAWLAAAGVAAGATLLMCESPAAKLFGTMDADWKAAVREASKYNFVDEWTARDWGRLAAGLFTLGLAAVVVPGAASRRLFAATAVVAAVGVAGFAAAAELPYAVFFQGQSYRAAWVVAVLQVPAAVGVAVAVWGRGPWHRAGGAVLVAAGVWGTPQIPPVEVAAAVGGILGAVFFRGIRRRPRDADWGWKAVAAGAVFGPAAGEFLLVAAVAVGAEEVANMKLVTPVWPQIIVRNAGPVCRGIVLAVAAAGLAGAFRRKPAVVAVLAGIVGLAVHAFSGMLAERPELKSAAADLAFAAEYLRTHSPGRRPVVFWHAPAYLWDCWYELRADAYHHPAQISGVIFHPETAAEARRRHALAGPLRYGLRSRDTAWDAATPPTAADLLKLAADPAIDFVILPVEFPGLWAATNGTAFVYDCRALRGRP